MACCNALSRSISASYNLIFKDSFFYSNGFRGPIAQLWLERTPDKRKVDGSTPSRPINDMGM